MLRELYIENLVLIDQMRIELRTGMTVFTGETGSGKSIIIDALALLAGERGRSELIKSGTNRLLVEGIFDWPPIVEFNLIAAELGLEKEDDCIIINREMTVNGRNTIRINGRSFPLSTLRLLVPWLINLHAQDDTHDLLSPAHYLTYLDQYDNSLAESVHQVEVQYTQYQNISKQLESYQEQRQSWLRERDFLAYQWGEIEDARLGPGEEDDLEARQHLVRNAGQMLQVLEQTDQLLFNARHGMAAGEMVNQARRLLARYQGESAFASLITPLDEIVYLLEDLHSQTQKLAEELEFEPAELEYIEDRLHLLHRLFKKYGANSREVIQTGEQIRVKLEQLDNWEENETLLVNQRQEALDTYLQLAGKASQLRQEIARQLAQAVNDELNQLAMPHAKFFIQVEKLDELGPHGMDKVTFLFSDNPGQEMRPVHRIASGGELSRLALALKVILKGQIGAQTFVFDEIDAGMSGHALEQIAARIAIFSEQRQVLLVTHAPIVAAYADHHFVISKFSDGEATVTFINTLDEAQVVNQLVKMMGEGHASETALVYARELRDSALRIRTKG